MMSIFGASKKEMNYVSEILQASIYVSISGATDIPAFKLM